MLLGTLDGEAERFFSGIPEDAERNVHVSAPDLACTAWTGREPLQALLLTYGAHKAAEYFGLPVIFIPYSQLVWTEP